MTTRPSMRKHSAAIDSEPLAGGGAGAVAARRGGGVGGHRRPAAAPRRRRLPMRLVYPDGSVIGAADPTLPTWCVTDPSALARRIGRHGLIGFGESYMAGEWTSTDLAGVLTVFATSMADLVPPSLQRLRPLAVARSARVRRNSRAGPAQHRRALRPVQRPVRRVPRRDMTYSSALFDSCPAAGRISPTHSGARSTGCSTSAGVGPAPGCSRSAPAGANCASARPRAEHTSAR